MVLKNIKDIFGKDKVHLELDEHERDFGEQEKIAVGALLLEMAGRDEDYAPEEVHTIFQLLMEEFELDEDECRSLLKRSDASREDESRLSLFIEELRQLNEEQRVRILAMCWKVILSDHSVDRAEEGFLTQLQNRLRLTSEHLQKAKEFAEAHKL